MSASPSSKSLNWNVCLSASQFVNILCFLSRPFRFCFSCFMNNLTIQVYFSSHFPEYFNNINCSSCIDQNRLNANRFNVWFCACAFRLNTRGSYCNITTWVSVAVSAHSICGIWKKKNFWKGLTWLHILVIIMLALCSIGPGNRCAELALKSKSTLP